MGAFILLAVIWSWVVDEEGIVISRKSNITKQGMLFYHLPESELVIQSDVKVSMFYDSNDEIIKHEIVEQKFTLTKKTISDTRQALSLQYNPTAMHSDDVELKINENGLLETTVAISEDQTTDIVKQLAIAPKEALEATKSATSRTFAAPNTFAEVVTKDYQKIFTIKARTLVEAETKKELSWTIFLSNDKGKVSKSINASLEVEVENLDEFRTDPDDGASKLKTFELENKEYKGILTRYFRDIQLHINLKEIASLNTSITTSIIDFNNAFLIPLGRSSFVKRENNVTFKDGFVQSNKIVNPSSYQGFVSIPINIAKAIISIPAQLFSIKIDNLKRTTELAKEKLEFEKATNDLNNIELKQELALVKLKAEIESEMFKQEEKRFEQLEKRFEHEIENKTRDLVLATELNDAKKAFEESKKSYLEVLQELNDLKSKLP